MKKLGSIGCGGMAQAIIGGLIREGTYRPEEIIASTRSQKSLERVKNILGIETSLNNKEIAQSEVVLLAVEPGAYPEVIEEIRDYIKEETIIWTIAAGVTIEQVENWFAKKVKVVRTMPNTPARVAEGVTGVTMNAMITEADRVVITKCIESFGSMEEIPESLMEGIIPVTGSSPAFIYMLIEAMADGAVREGFSRKQAIRLAAQTVLGTAKMVLETEEHPAILKDQVCTPGGITIELVKKMEEMGFRNAVLEGMEACHVKK